MSFQWIFDKAAGLTIDKQPTVAQQISRNNRPTSVVRGGYTYRFIVKMPDGLPYSEARPYIEAYEKLGRYTIGAVSIPQSYISGYRGAAASTSGWTGSWTTGNVTLTANPNQTMTSGDLLVGAGDLIQLGTGNTYTAIEDTVWPSQTVTVNREIIDATGTGSISIGENVSWDVMCTSIPVWNIFDYNLVTWDGTFVFYEVVRE